MTQSSYIQEARELLQHGGVATGLATVALARNPDADEPVAFRVLSPELTAGASKVIAALERGISRQGIEAAITRALENPDTVAPPQFAVDLIGSLDALTGELTDTQKDSISGIFHDFATGSPHDRGLMILACALCRTRDSVLALGRHLAPPDASLLYRSACLAGATCEPGLPSALRQLLRRVASHQR